MYLCEVAIVSQLCIFSLIYYMGCVKITSLATLLSMRLCLQVVLRHVGDIAASGALHICSGPCSYTGNRLGCSSHFIYQSPYKNRHVHLLGKHWPPKCFVLFLSMLFHMIHCVDLTVWVCLLVCKHRIPRATRESFNNPD